MTGKNVWVKSDWKAKELNHKSVEFRIPGYARGRGELRARTNPKGLLAVTLVVVTEGQDWKERSRTVVFLPQVAVDRIARHPNPETADFALK